MPIVLSNSLRLHALTKAFYRRLPAELRQLTYGFVLDSKTKRKVARQQCDPRPSTYPTPRTSPTRVILDLNSMDRNVAREIANYFHTSFTNNGVIGAQNIAKFLAHDFLGIGVRPADSKIQRLNIDILVEDTCLKEPCEVSADFEPLLALEQKWATPFFLHVRLFTRMSILGEFQEAISNNTRGVLKAFGEVVAQAEKKGGEKAVGVDFGGAVYLKSSRWFADYKWNDVYGDFLRDSESVWRQKMREMLTDQRDLWHSMLVAAFGDENLD
jgi:hypothetical protein